MAFVSQLCSKVIILILICCGCLMLLCHCLKVDAVQRWHCMCVHVLCDIMDVIDSPRSSFKPVAIGGGGGKVYSSWFSD
jgi:hypothetical protein